MGDLVLGYAGAFVAVFFFGTCYVPAKKYPTYGAFPTIHSLSCNRLWMRLICVGMHRVGPMA